MFKFLNWWQKEDVNEDYFRVENLDKKRELERKDKINVVADSYSNLERKYYACSGIASPIDIRINSPACTGE
jgi:hypothetical protein